MDLWYTHGNSLEAPGPCYGPEVATVHQQKLLQHHQYTPIFISGSKGRPGPAHSAQRLTTDGQSVVPWMWEAQRDTALNVQAPW